MKLQLRIKSIVVQKKHYTFLPYLVNKLEEKGVIRQDLSKGQIKFSFNKDKLIEIGKLKDYFSSIESLEFYKKEDCITKNVSLELGVFGLTQGNLKEHLSFINLITLSLGMHTDLLSYGADCILMINLSNYEFRNKEKQAEFEEILELTLSSIYTVF